MEICTLVAALVAAGAYYGDSYFLTAAVVTLDRDLFISDPLIEYSSSDYYFSSSDADPTNLLKELPIISMSPSL